MLAEQEVAMTKKLVFLAILGLAAGYWNANHNLAFAEPGHSTSGHEVILYATAWCGYCQKTREFFSKNNIAYVEYDIEKSDRRRREHKRLGGKGVPLVQINGRVIHGYNPKLMLAYLNSD